MAPTRSGPVAATVGAPDHPRLRARPHPRSRHDRCSPRRCLRLDGHPHQRGDQSRRSRYRLPTVSRPHGTMAAHGPVLPASPTVQPNDRDGWRLALSAGRALAAGAIHGPACHPVVGDPADHHRRCAHRPSSGPMDLADARVHRPLAENAGAHPVSYSQLDVPLALAPVVAGLGRRRSPTPPRRGRRYDAA